MYFQGRVFCFSASVATALVIYHRYVFVPVPVSSLGRNTDERSCHVGYEIAGNSVCVFINVIYMQYIICVYIMHIYIYMYIYTYLAPPHIRPRVHIHLSSYI